MAEIDFDNDDDGQDDIGEVDNLLDEAAGGGFFTQKRIVIIAIVVGVVFLIGAVLFGLMMSGSSKPKKKTSSQQGQQVSSKSEQKNKKNLKFEKLFDQLTSAQVSGILRELSFADISFQTKQAGQNFTILVDEKQVENAQRLLAIKGLPDGGSRGYELLDENQTLGVTEFDKRIRFLRALAGELEKAIIQFDAIETCKVNIVLPEQRLFAVTQPPVTSSILVRRRDGYIINDSTVFSIIKLVANAVENLQPENVSVIDTEGLVLSAGIFDRMDALNAQGGTKIDNKEKQTEIDEDILAGNPIIPNFKDMKQWFEIKQKYERKLERKAIKQLFGVLPFKSFKLAITADIGAIENGEVMDVKRLTTSIVVDISNEDIFLDLLLKKQIFTTIAGAIGYVRGRDTIQLSKADGLTFTKEELERLEEIKRGKKGMPWWMYMFIILGSTAGVLYYRKRKKNQSKMGDLMIGGDNRFSGDSRSDSSAVTRLKDLAATNPDIIAQIMEEWLEAEKVEA